VHELQVLLAPADRGVLVAERNHLALDRGRIRIDAHPGAVSPLQLMADLDGLDPGLDRWLVAERQRFGRAAMRVAEAALVHGTFQGLDPAIAMAAAENLLAVDPVSEAAWRVLIAGHFARGQRAAGMEAFQNCVAVLAERAGIEPSPETQAVAERGRAVRRASPPPRPPPRRSRGARLGVRPFRTFDDGASEPLALGLAEEITTALARFRWFFLVASPSLGELRGEPAADAPGWRDLALDFLLDGSIQRSGPMVRVSARLLDLHAGPEVVWAARFDRPASDLLSLQDDIAAEAVAQIDPAILLREGQRAAGQLPVDHDAYALTMSAVPAIYRLEEASFRAAGRSLAEAVEIDPDFALAHTWYACWHLFHVGQNWAEDNAAAMGRAAELAERAVALDPSDARAVTIAGHIRAFLDHRVDEAMQMHERALSLNPCLPLAWVLSGLAHCYAGDHREAIGRIGHALRLSPRDPHAFFFDMALMLAHLALGEDEKVVETAREALALNPLFTSSYKIALSALGHLGRGGDIAPLAARLLALEPNFSVATSARRTPLRRPEDARRYADGLRRAGLPG
jgi:TolB-like protein/Tfp pilus assembly protein PilF